MPACTFDDDEIARSEILDPGRIQGDHDRTGARLSSDPAQLDPSAHRRSGVPLPHIAASDLDVAILGQLAAANLPLDDQFEPRPVNIIGFDAALWGGGVAE